MKKGLLLLSLLIAVAACGDFPADPEGTLKRVRAEQTFRVGMIAPLGETQDQAQVRALLEGVGKAAGAVPQVHTGDAEPLLKGLEEGELDLVIGRFEEKSPWRRLVSLTPPLKVERHGKIKFHLAAAMRNGENAWIGLVERQARDIGGS